MSAQYRGLERPVARASIAITCVEAKAKYAFPVKKLKTQADLLQFAAGLEKGAVSAYLGAVPLFLDRQLSRAAANPRG